jgi:hypothetical protein
MDKSQKTILNLVVVRMFCMLYCNFMRCDIWGYRSGFVRDVSLG